MGRFRALVVFDLDGTLLRGRTVCEVLAEPLGRLERMRELERFTSIADLRAAREEMAAWYRPVGIGRLRDELRNARLAPGAVDGLAWLGRHGVAVGIASITWSFAVEYFARGLGVRYWQGTGLDESGDIQHVWPEDKASWVRELARGLGVSPERTAVVGDSTGDTAMLDAVGVPVFVGPARPAAQRRWLHRPAANIAALARHLVDLWNLPGAAPTP